MKKQEKAMAETEDVPVQKTRQSVESTVQLTARVNLVLPDGRFVSGGETIEVSQEYFNRVRTESDGRFI